MKTEIKTPTEWQADGQTRERRYFAVLDGTMSTVEQGSLDTWCQACNAEAGHATESEAYRCLATWFRKEAETWRTMAKLADRDAERARELTTLEREHGTGCVAARRNQQTGALRQLYRPGTQAEGSSWLIICKPHGSVLDVDTRKRGEQAFAELDWCEDCWRHVHGDEDDGDHYGLGYMQGRGAS